MFCFVLTGNSFSLLMNFRSLIRKYLLYSAVAFLSIVLILFIFRDLIASYYLQKKIDQFNIKNHAELKVEKIRIQWLASILITGISLKPEKGDTLLKIDSVYVSVNEWKLLSRRIVFNDLELKNIHITLIRHDSVNNYSFLFSDRKHEKQSDTLSESMNYAYAADRFAGFIFDKIPGWMIIQNLNISGNTNGHLVSVHFEHFAFKNHTFNVPVFVNEDCIEQTWIFTGNIDRRERIAMLRLFSSGNGKVALPFIKYKWNAEMGFDTVSFRLEETVNDKDMPLFLGSVAFHNLDLYHEGISKQHVCFDQLSVDYNIRIGKNYAEVDSSTLITFNRLKINPYIRYQHKPVKQLTFLINKASFPADDLFSSLPNGLFTTLEGIKVKGDLSFYLRFFVDLSIPDSLQFDCELRRYQFYLLSYGNTDLSMMNEPFLYTAYEKGEPVRTFVVGPENPNFRPLEKMPSFLKSSILTSEDPSFFQHRGFLSDAFRESIITDIKERKFARGGSTISMQLIKNVFLSKQKTIARKLEEALLVWLIENQNLTTKERMFEVYLNIIEWGPLVYGAQEASKFYFNKDVSRLTLAESIFLASIIPKPKWFKYSFDETGHLRDSQIGFFNLLSGKMLNRGLISQHDFDNLIPDVELQGQARLLLKKHDTIPADSLFDQEER